jgi:hypothetical protein
MARELMVTSPIMRGDDVLAVQTRLSALGYAPGPVDGAYGPTTAAAVKDFQASHDLAADGIVGPQTLAALLAAPVPGPPGPPPRPPSAIGLAALTEATRHLGVKEAPPGSNETPFGIWFGKNGVPWCNIFVSYCFQLGAGYTLCNGFSGPGVVPGKGCAYVPTTEHWLSATGMWVGRTEPQPGDIAIFNWDGGQPDHIGIVQRNDGNGVFTTIEGNTSVSNNSDGGEVMQRSRHILQVDGFGRVTQNG